MLPAWRSSRISSNRRTFSFIVCAFDVLTKLSSAFEIVAPDIIQFLLLRNCIVLLKTLTHPCKTITSMTDSCSSHCQIQLLLIEMVITWRKREVLRKKEWRENCSDSNNCSENRTEEDVGQRNVLYKWGWIKPKSVLNLIIE